MTTRTFGTFGTGGSRVVGRDCAVEEHVAGGPSGTHAGGTRGTASTSTQHGTRKQGGNGSYPYPLESWLTSQIELHESIHEHEEATIWEIPYCVAGNYFRVPRAFGFRVLDFGFKILGFGFRCTV